MADDLETKRHEKQTLEMTNAIIEICNKATHPANVVTALQIVCAHMLVALNVPAEVFFARVEASVEVCRAE